MVQSGGESIHRNIKQLLVVTLKKYLNYSVNEWWKEGYFSFVGAPKPKKNKVVVVAPFS